MDTTRRTAADPAADRLASLRSRPTGVSPALPRRALFLPLLLVCATAIVVAAAVFMMGLFGDSQPTVASETPQVSYEAQEAEPELLAGEANIAFAVEQGNFPPLLEPGDVIRVVVTPGPDGVGEYRVVEDEVVVLEVSETTDVSTDVVLTVRGSESLLKVIAASGPVHVAHVGTIRGEP